MGEILSALGSFPKEVGLELGLEGWWEFGRCGWELRRASRGWAGLNKGQRWECSLCPQSRKGLVGAESGKGGQGQTVRGTQSQVERAGRTEGAAERGKPKPGFAVGGQGREGAQEPLAGHSYL